ncbi:ABC transport system protein [Desulfurococcaceae archaeon AG1]|nr:ABC transport system protein [Desulfurococcaceae archaeon AG1]
MGGAFIELDNVWKIYRVGVIDYPALRGVSLSIDKGSFVSIVGPSGSGKSTLLHLIGGLDRPTRGEIRVSGQPISSLSDNRLAEYRNKTVGFVFQQYNLIPYLSAIENVEIPMIVSGVPPKQRREKARRLLEELGLGDKIWKKPLELSGGEQQRVAIARALANDPSIVLADEPTGNLDGASAKVVVDLLKRINEERGVTVIIVTHNMEVAWATKRIIYLRDGVVVKEEVRKQ